MNGLTDLKNIINLSELCSKTLFISLYVLQLIYSRNYRYNLHK